MDKRIALLDQINKFCQNDIDVISQDPWSQLTTQQLQTVVMVMESGIVSQIIDHNESNVEKTSCFLLEDIVRFLSQNPNARNPLTGRPITSKQRASIFDAYQQAVSQKRVKTIVEWRIEVCKFKITSEDRRLCVLVDAWPFEKNGSVNKKSFVDTLVKYYKEQLKDLFGNQDTEPFPIRVPDVPWRLEDVKHQRGNIIQIILKADDQYHKFNYKMNKYILLNTPQSLVDMYDEIQNHNMSEWIEEWIANVRHAEHGRLPICSVISEMLE